MIYGEVAGRRRRLFYAGVIQARIGRLSPARSRFGMADENYQGHG
jgi:hypothetical protein